MPASRLSILFERFLAGACTSEEKQELAELVLNKEQDSAIGSLLENAWANAGNMEAEMSKEKADDFFRAILDEETAATPRVHQVHFRRLRWWAAASIVLLLGLGSYFMFFHDKKSGQAEIVQAEPVKDIKAPATNRAMITLADGRTVYLDSADNGQLATQGNIKLVKLANGQIAYQPANGELLRELKYNTLTNPRGSKVIDITLADGSHVWLNAGSSITYPVAFIGSERKVSITGEAYFEVAHDESKPFYMSKGDMSVQVLGTKFNVNAYDDEPAIKVTLLEGSVEMKSEKSKVKIRPGEQALTTSNGQLEINKNVDVEEVMAWKNGRFVFGEKADIQTIMRQVARWYDVDIEYKGTFNTHFGGSISRQVNVSEILKVLEASGGVKGKVEGRNVILTPISQSH